MNGTHGTTVEITRRVEKEGFKSSQVGRAGAGVYFWRYFNNDKYAKYLAYKWWEYSNKAGNYNNIGGDTNYCCISVKIESDNYIDFSHGVMKEKIIELISDKLDEIKNSKTEMSDDEIISGLFVTYIHEIEKARDKPIDALVTILAQPKGSAGTLGKYIGSSAEAIVVMNLNTIKILKTEEIQND